MNICSAVEKSYSCADGMMPEMKGKLIIRNKKSSGFDRDELIVTSSTKPFNLNSQVVRVRESPVITIKREDLGNKPAMDGNKIEQWVEKVFSYSSQYDADTWNADQIIGEPKVYPRYGDIRGAWAQGCTNARQYIEVGFKTPVYLEKIEIFETYHGGGVKRIVAIDTDNLSHEVWHTNIPTDIRQARIFCPPIVKTKYRCSRLKIDVDCSAAKSWVEIDAVRITGTKDSGETVTNNETKNMEQSSDIIEHWVSAVIDFSSQYDNKSWPASCVIGPPKVYPKYGDIPGAWAPKIKDDQQYLLVEFPEKLYIIAVQIYETYHSGGVKCIKAKQPDGRFLTVWNNPKVVDLKYSRILAPSFQQLTFPCNVLRIEVDCSVCCSWVEIDAVKIMGTKTPGGGSTPSAPAPPPVKTYVPAGPPICPPTNNDTLLRPRIPPGASTKPAKSDRNVMELFVSRVVNFSSQYDSVGWAAHAVVGTPKVYPNYGDLCGSWAPGDVDANQFIEVEFADKLYIEKIEIYETYNSGGVKKIKAKRPNGEWFTAWETPNVDCISVSRIFTPPIKKLDFLCNTVRIETDCSFSGDWVEIDAVKITGTKFKFDIVPNKSDIGLDMKKMVNNPMFSDIKFLVNRTAYHAHKVVLYARCAYFSSQFNESVKKQTGGSTLASQTPMVPSAPPMTTKLQNESLYPTSNDTAVNPQPVMPTGPVPGPASYREETQIQTIPVIEIKDVTPTAFLMVLFYLYTNDIPASCLPQAFPDVWRAAHKFGIEDLKTCVLLKLPGVLHVNNVIEVYKQSVLAPSPIENMKEICEQFIQNNKAEVVRHQSFMSLPKEMVADLTKLMV